MSGEGCSEPIGSDVTRRGFVAGIAAAAVSLPLAVQPARADDDEEEHGRPKERVDNKVVKTHRLADIYNNTIYTNYVRKYGFLLVRKDDNIYAISTTCTHQGCEITPGGKGYHCECHGATYDVLGNVTHKPAKKPLARFALHINKDSVVEVDTGRKVDHDSPEGVINLQPATRKS